MQTKRPFQQSKRKLEDISAWLAQKIASYAQMRVSEIDRYESFAGYGLSSMDAISISGELEEWLGYELPPTLLYDYPTIERLAQALVDPGAAASLPNEQSTSRSVVATQDIAIIGMAGRFPGASNVDEFWQNIRAGIESITLFSPEELIAAGCDPGAIHQSSYIRARPVLKTEEVECFDAAFFGYSPHEATFTDPQHRLFLECTWEALERAGYDPGSYDGLIGVYAGCSLSTYLLALAKTDYIQNLDDYQIVIGHDKDSLTSTVSYKLNLKGPSLAVQTFCSTSLVAISLACQSLLHGQCDIALAGGVSVRAPATIGYHYHEGGMESHDGHCRAFDSQASGTLFGDGAGVVVLKRLQDALQDNDTIDAVIKGSAINNDGSLKVSYTAPGIIGQSSAVTRALLQAGIDASTLGYVEAHGSATEMGDPIEVTALSRAFRQQTDRQGYCGLGSVKTNIGHMDRAAGVAGLIKVVQALKHKELPPTLHIQTPNPRLELEHSPFFLTRKLMPWHSMGVPRRAGVNSLGLGGTNAHIVLEEAPELPATGLSRPWQLLLLSARTATALEETTRNIHQHLQERRNISLADVAYTLQIGRKKFEHRRFIFCKDRQDALQLLTTPASSRVFDQTQKRTDCQVIFLFPDVGEQYPHMAQDLYLQEPFFRQEVDHCCSLLYDLTGQDLRLVLYLDEAAMAAALIETELAEPALFVIEYALARLLMQWGIRPQAMFGYSLGEYVAATIAGVLSLEDALTLVARRAQLIATQPVGAMLSVALSEEEMRSWLFSSAKRELTQLIRGMTLHAPAIPYISNVTGTWITDEQATSYEYWARHMCETARCADGVGCLLQKVSPLFVQVGIGQALESFVRPACDKEDMPKIIPTLPDTGEDSYAFFLTSIGRLWVNGVAIDWKSFYAEERRRRVPLPTYPFERQRYWIPVQDWRQSSLTKKYGSLLANECRSDIASWFSVPSWKQAPPPRSSHHKSAISECWLIFLDEVGISTTLGRHFRAMDQRVVWVTPGQAFKAGDSEHYQINPRLLTDYQRLLYELSSQDMLPTRVLHSWSITAGKHTTVEPALSILVQQQLDLGFYSLCALAQALGEMKLDHCTISVLANGIYDVLGQETLSPGKATILGPCQVIPQEYTTLDCHLVEIVLPDFPTLQAQEALLEQLVYELTGEPGERVVALRGNRRWLPTFEEVQIAEPASLQNGLRERGVYLITGGLGGIGLALAAYLAETVHARLLLTSREGLPPRSTWPEVMRTGKEESHIRRRITTILALEQQGAEVLVLSADVTNEIQMKQAIDHTYAAFGELNGVFHLAGVPGMGLTQLKTPEAAAAVLAPKVQGTLVLARLLRDTQLDFLVLFSSVTAIIGGPGQVDYSAANAFLDAFARSQRSGTHVLAIDWSEWQWDAWSDGLAGYSEATRTLLVENRRVSGLSFKEGMEALQRLLTTSFAQVIVSKQAIHTLVDMSNILSINSQEQSSLQPVVTHTRPSLNSSYIAPRDDNERKMARIWEELLAIDGIGIYDNFFDLGGNSLLGMSLLIRVRKEFNLAQLPAHVLYEAPCIEAMTQHITRDHQKATSGVFDERSSKRQHLLRKRMQNKNS